MFFKFSNFQKHFFKAAQKFAKLFFQFNNNFYKFVLISPKILKNIFMF